MVTKNVWIHININRKLLVHAFKMHLDKNPWPIHVKCFFVQYDTVLAWNKDLKDITRNVYWVGNVIPYTATKTLHLKQGIGGGAKMNTCTRPGAVSKSPHPTLLCNDPKDTCTIKDSPKSVPQNIKLTWNGRRYGMEKNYHETIWPSLHRSFV